MQAVESLDCYATVGDVAAQAGLQVLVAEQGLLALASEVGGQLEVAASGDVAYRFPKNFRSILRGKYWQLRFKAGLSKVWQAIFYVIRIFFGVALLASIAILAIALVVLAIAAMTAASSRDDDNNGGSVNLGGFSRVVGDLLGGALRLFFYANWYGWGPSYGGYSSSSRASQRSLDRGQHRSAAGQSRAQEPSNGSDLNFLEAVFSFLFGDGNPNADLEERRWGEIGRVIRRSQGAIAAEQVMPFLDASPQTDPDDAILPVLVRFQGYPQVSPSGDLVYQFPDLQVSAAEGLSPSSISTSRSSSFLQEHPWRFSRATPTQRWSAGLLGGINLGLAVALGLQLPALQALSQTTGGGFLVFVAQIYPLLLLYGLGFLTVPLIRWQVVRWRDRQVQKRNQQRQAQAQRFRDPSPELLAKLTYAQQFAQHRQLKAEDAVYTTEQDLIEQEIAQKAQQDDEWQRRLGGR